MRIFAFAARAHAAFIQAMNATAHRFSESGAAARLSALMDARAAWGSAINGRTRYLGSSRRTVAQDKRRAIKARNQRRAKR